jgi:hypothetical protein
MILRLIEIGFIIVILTSIQEKVSLFGNAIKDLFFHRFG